MKILFGFLFTSCVLLLVALGLLPSILSTEWGKEKFIQGFNYVSEGSLKIGGLEIGWMGKQRIENIEWRDAGGELRFACPKIEVDASLSQILFQHDVGHMVVKMPQITLVAKKNKEPVIALPEPMGFISMPTRGGRVQKDTKLAYQPLFRVGFFDWIKYCGKLDIEQGNVTFLSEKLPPLKFEKLDMHATRLEPDELQMETVCQITEKDFAGTVNITGAISDIGTARQDISLEARLHNFPMRSLDQIASVFEPQMEGVFLDLMGESLSADLKLKSSAKTLALDIDASSSQFSIYARTDSNQTEISLHTPALLTWTLSPKALHKLTGITAKQDVTALLKINRLLLPIANQNAFGFQAELRTSEVVLDNATIEPVVVSLATDDFQKGIFIGSIHSKQVSCEKLLFSWKEGVALLKPAAFTGDVKGTLSTLEIPPDWEKLSFNADLTLNLPQLDPFHLMIKCKSIKDIALTLQNKQVDLTLQGRVNPKEGFFTIKDPIAFTYHLEHLPTELPALTAPADIEVQISPCSIPLAMSEIYKLRLQGKGKISTLAFKEHTVKNLTFSFEGNGKNQTLELAAEGAVGGATFTGLLKTHGWNQEADIHIKAKGENLPTDFISLWLPADVQLADLLGHTITLDFDGTSSPTNNTMSIKADTPNFTCDLAMKQKEGSIELMQPGKASFKLTKDSYAALDKLIGPSSFEITEGTNLELTISELTLPTKESKSRIPSIVYDMQTMQLQGDCLVEKLSFLNKENEEKTVLNHLKIHLSQPSKKSPLAFQIHGAADEQGVLSLQGQFDHTTRATSLNCNVQQFPTTLFDILTKSAFSFGTVFGPTLNLTATAKIQESSGPIKLSLHSSHARASLDGLLTKGVLTLNDTIYAQVTLTKELSKLLLKGVSPLSNSVIKADSPLTLEIPKEGFSLPLLPFSLKTATMPHVTIELGKLLSENKGNLSEIVGILKLSTASKEKEIGIWFSPINLTLTDGIIALERTELLLADAYQICTWGTIDLVKNDVNLVLGLTESCLRKAFKIQNLPETYVLQIPVTGPLEDIHVNTALATTKVAALILWQQQAKIGSLGKGAAGGLLGDFLNKIGPIPDGDSKAPPANHPLPWEATPTQLSNKTPDPTESPKKKKHFKPQEKPLKQILKMVR